MNTRKERLPLAIGLDFGGTSVKLGVCRGAELVARSKPIPTQGHATVDSLVETMVGRIRALREEHPEIAAVGAGVPGFVDHREGFIHHLTNVPGWTAVPFRRLLEERIGIPVSVENDANAMAYAEWKHGAGQGMRDLVCVALGTGVGGGLILNGGLFRGAAFGAGEIGQMSVDYRGRAGNYGNLGALEKYVGNQQIADHAIAAYAAAGLPVADPKEVTPERLAAAAAAGDAVARAVWEDVAGWLGAALANCVWLLNPDAVIVGGGVARAGEVLFGPLRERMRSLLNPVFWERLRLIPARFGHEAGIIGCAALALDERPEHA